MISHFGAWVLITLAATLNACASSYVVNCRNGDRVAIHDSLFFGTAKPDGFVTADEWAAFMESAVSPRFPRGLTLSRASGQWRGPDGEIVREDSHVLQIVHFDEPETESAVREIIKDYKARFRQESVLRIRTHTCASF
jgi:hypothetical protein